MNKPQIPDGDETRAGFRSGEGSDSVLRHLLATARRRQKQKPAVDSRLPAQPPREGEPGIGVDVQLPP